MKIPQLFLRIGEDRYQPVTEPQHGHELYFWDDESQEMTPAHGILKHKEIEGALYLVLEARSCVSSF